MEPVKSRFLGLRHPGCMDFFNQAFVLEDALGNVVAFVRDEAVAKKVQWAIAAQAAAKEAGIPDPTAQV